MSARASRYNYFRLALVAVLCALPFLLGAIFLYHHVQRVDNLPLDRYGELRWLPGDKDLAFLHQPLRQTPPAETELWRVTGTGTSFDQVGALSAERDWELTKQQTGTWILLFGRKSDQDVVMALADGTGKVKMLDIDKQWKLLPSQGNGLFFAADDDQLQFDQFVDVEDAPDLEQQEDPTDEPPLYQEYPEEERFEEEPTSPPTRLGLRLGLLDAESGKIETDFSIPYDQPEQRPEVQLVRQSPDKRFIALIVRFGDTGAPGLWVYDSQTGRLLWTRMRVTEKAYGLDWSSDSVKIAFTDKEGLNILENALGFESTKLAMSASEMLLPSWGAGANLYLHNSHVVYSVGKDREQAQPLFDSRGKGEGFSDLALDAMGGRAAYTAAPRGYRELVVRELRSGQNLAKVALPGSIKEKAQGTIMYQIGNAIRFSWRRWTGRG